MSNDIWEQKERELQDRLNSLEVRYHPCVTLTVTVLRGRKISVGFFHDFFDVPDSQVYVKCEQASGLKNFKTKVARNSRNPEWNESFTFILDGNGEDAKVEIDVYEEDRFKRDPHLGKFTFETKDWGLDKRKCETLNMNKHGQIDLEMVKQRRAMPDCRMSLGLSKQEREYRIKRKPKTNEAIRKFLGDEKGPKSLTESPTIALAITGGGYRAVATSCGAMEAMAESGLADTLMYFAGLSGSSWYISTSYLHRALGSYHNLVEHHDWLRAQMGSSLAWCFFDISFYRRYKEYRDFKHEHLQKTTFVDFYGLALGEVFLGKDKTKATLSSLQSYVQTADVPFPILSCAHVHEYLPMSEFWDEVEMTPFEITFPGYGINIPTEKFNSKWANGILQQDLPEPPLHFLMGASGSAFAILLSKVSDKAELENDLQNYIEKVSVNESHHKENPEAESEDEDDVPGAVAPAVSLRKKAPENFASADDRWIEILEQKASRNESNVANDPPVEHDTFGRSFLLGRTAKVSNCATYYTKLQKYRFNTEPIIHKQENSDRFRQQISTTKAEISLCDSALGCNLPAVHVIRPQRAVDVLIAVDASNYFSESSLMMELFATVQDHLHDHGLKFPQFCIEEKIAADPFREFYLFEHPDDPEYPIVLWFTLANRKFRNQENAHRRPGYPTPDAADKGEVKFNDFNIFPESSDFGTMRLSFSALNFDRLRELMRFNIMDNMSTVKETIARKVEQLRL